MNQIEVDGRILKVGDLVFAYRKGIWEIDEFEEYSNNYTLVKLTLIYNKIGNKPKNIKTDKCHIDWCFTFDQMIEKKNEEIKDLQKLKEKINGK